MRKKGNITNTAILITLRILTLLIVPSSARMITNIVIDKTAVIAYGQVNKMVSDLTRNSVKLAID